MPRNWGVQASIATGVSPGVLNTQAYFVKIFPCSVRKKTLNINNKENIEIIFWAVFFNDKLN